jgi:hypothetical protein
MLKRWATWPPGIRWLAGIAAIVLAAAIVWALFVPLADWLARHDVGSAKPDLLQKARDAARGRLLTLVAGLFAAGALVFTALNFTLSRRTFELTEQGQVTDRFTKAIEQLGSDKLDVRIGGIYALERVARDSAKDHPTVMEVLAAFIRGHSREPWPPQDTGSSSRTGAASRASSGTASSRRPARTVRYLAARSSLQTGNPPEREFPRPDILAAVTVVVRRDAERDIRRIDLTEAVLSRFNLGAVNLAHAWLPGADLSGANLSGADFADAFLTGADLTGAFLTDAKLPRANLRGANLSGADLTRADLPGGYLPPALLTLVDDFSGADLADVRWPEGARVPPGWTVDSDSGRLKRADGLSEAQSSAAWISSCSRLTSMPAGSPSWGPRKM